MKILKLLKSLFIKEDVTHFKTEEQLNRMSKDELEVFARTIGLELDKRLKKETLVKQILAEQKYYE